MEESRLRKAKELFGVPEEFYDVADLMVREPEWDLIAFMNGETMAEETITAYADEQRLSGDAPDFIRECYHRAILNKVPQDDGSMKWKSADFYTRFPIYAQYEYYEYSRLPRETIEKLNAWDFQVYYGIYSHDVKQKMAGVDTWVHNSHYLTLKEADAIVDRHADSIYLTACNCKAMMVFHGRPINVCVNFDGGPNSILDRGHGERLTAEETKKKLREFNKAGLMQNGEDFAICNCDGYCCYPLHMARKAGSRGIYPRSHYHIDWHEDECVACGKCTKICNFGAFTKEGKKITYHPDLCWECTICSENCPKGAIHLIPREDVAPADL